MFFLSSYKCFSYKTPFSLQLANKQKNKNIKRRRGSQTFSNNSVGIVLAIHIRKYSMEYSVNYSVRRKAFSNHPRTIYEEQEEEEEVEVGGGVEESSWTMYFEEEDHEDDDNEVETEEGSCYYDGSSMISDAASPGDVAKKIADRNCNRIATSKRRRVVHQCQDDEARKEASSVVGDLEDTASSPSNSPKVCSMLEEMDKDTRQESTRDITKEKGCATETRSIIKGMNHEELSIELKKRGLCLVPMSMLSLYLG